jgi:hypothetical protein
MGLLVNHMKKCTYCGKEYANEATSCAVDQQPLMRVDSPGSNQPQPEAAPVANSYEKVTAIETANHNMLVGGLWCGGGLLVTALSYAGSSNGGGYVFAWGAIIFGGVQFFRGLLAKSRL